MRDLRIGLHPRKALMVSALLVLSLTFPAWADAQNGSLTAVPLEVGFTRYAFLNVNRNDAEASFKAFLHVVGRQRGYDIEARVHVYDDAAAFEAAVKSGSIDMVVIDSWRYLGMDIHKLVTPYFITGNQGMFGKRYLLLTKNGSNLKTLADLRGKDIVQIEVTNSNLGRPWLESVLMESRMGAPGAFFGRVESVGKPSAAVLPVFFGTRDACLVDETGFEVMKELNPQVGKAVQVVAASEPLADALICLRNSSWSSEKFKRDVIEILGELDGTPTGQQILTLFKVGQLLPFQDAYLETVRKLRTKHEKLRRENEQ